LTLPPAFLSSLGASIGPRSIRDRSTDLQPYAADALGIGAPPDLVVIPESTQDVSTVARLCHEHRVPLVVRGAGTGYTGGAVPVRGGVVVSLERFTRILSLDPRNLLVVVQPA